MKRLEQLQLIEQHKIVAVVRAPQPDQLVEVLHALAAGGIRVAEVTFTVPDADQVIRAAKKQLGEKILIGAGTILDTETARIAIMAGAEFLVSPTVNVDVIALAHRYDRAIMPGAFTPTEILAAWEAGADIVKVFPAECLGPKFFKAMRGPLPQIKLMPTGGVDLTTAGDFLAAGACALGIGSQLVDPHMIAKSDFTGLTELAKKYVKAVIAA
ncbi:MAG: bifunctional 4-hydroxy-2-oxoglutarate aldolase/2-dehydro-3-deoxy-phosphogluconate aldolase [Zavarzinella sp.]